MNPPSPWVHWIAAAGFGLVAPWLMVYVVALFGTYAWFPIASVTWYPRGITAPLWVAYAVDQCVVAVLGVLAGASMAKFLPNLSKRHFLLSLALCAAALIGSFLQVADGHTSALLLLQGVPPFILLVTATWLGHRWRARDRIA